MKKYKRVLIKISGEALGKAGKDNLDFNAIGRLAKDLSSVASEGVKVSVVVGGGNIFRGRSAPKGSIDRTTADYMGMVGTIINAIALQAEIEQTGVDCRVLTALSIKEVAEDYIRRQAMSHLEAGKIVIFAAGTGNPYFTTDTTAALRALEINAEVILKATTNVDGVYTSDPKKSNNKKAKLLKEVSFHEALVQRLEIMDSTAFGLCRDNNLPIIVFKYRPGVVMKIIKGEKIGTVVS